MKKAMLTGARTRAGTLAHHKDVERDEAGLMKHDPNSRKAYELV